MPEIIEPTERPKFFTHCPVCNAETPEGSVTCPKCNVNLEIARANLMKGIALEVGKVGFVVGHNVGAQETQPEHETPEPPPAQPQPIQPPPNKKTFWSVVGSVISFCITGFVCLFIYGLVKDMFIMPVFFNSYPTSAPATYYPPIHYTPTPYHTETPRIYSKSEVVNYKTLQIYLMGTDTHDLIYTGQDVAWYPKPGSRIISLAVRVHNSGAPLRVRWEDVGVIVDQQGWYANFGSTQVSDKTNFNAFSIGISETIAAEFVFNGGATTYMRLIFFVDDDPNKTIYFQIQSSPYIEFTVP